MGRYMLHRVFQMIPLLVLISVLVFALLTSMPGDPLDRMLEDNPDFTYEVFAGTVIVETVFSYPGMGKLLYDSIMGNDFVVSMAILMLLALHGALGQLDRGRALWVDRPAHPLRLGACSQIPPRRERRGMAFSCRRCPSRIRDPFAVRAPRVVLSWWRSRSRSPSFYAATRSADGLNRRFSTALQSTFEKNDSMYFARSVAL
jgi:hypothetical protein